MLERKVGDICVVLFESDIPDSEWKGRVVEITELCYHESGDHYTVEDEFKNVYWFSDEELEDYQESEEHVAVAEGSKEEVNKALGIDMVNAPKHYQLFHKDDIEGDFIEVKHVVKAVLERWEQQENISFDFYQAGCYKELLQYLLRAPLKNNIEDVQKAGYYLKEVIDEW